MCPLWPFHIIIMYLLMLAPLWIVAWGATMHAVKSLPMKFSPSSVEMQMGQTKQIHVYSNDTRMDEYKWLVEMEKDREYVVDVNKTYLVNVGDDLNWTSVFDVKANFLGKVNLKLRTYDANNKTVVAESSDLLTVTVLREKRIIDKVFTYSVVILVSLLYINFGCALEWEFMKGILRRPIGPAIGFTCQFLFMPLLGYGLGKLLFSDMPEMRLGLFFMGLSPGGGASNVWSVALEANVDLSIAMTTISSISAFAMIPFWLYALGQNILKEAEVYTPFSHIMHHVICLIIPIGIGCAIQTFFPRVSKVLVRLLKPISVALLLFIVVFAIVTNVYIFQLLTWRILVAGLSLPWLGYLLGYAISWLLGQPLENKLAIAVETGVQNTGIAIFMLRLSLEQPAADLVTVMPVSVSLMTPIPLSILCIALKLRSRWRGKKISFPVKNEIQNGHTLI